ncbi:nadph-dependent fmn reductase domain containing protein [Entamoeba histolytica]|uniref:Iron-sulfur flavoprotein, putative n=2 Tax=Entamoeba histolytica TaxID=5759 RepID=C4LUJ7_ENTH1|nr:iron-sulfur flavoprotein, putative [Entamoeba histolytica HM-1:IMSS]EAL42874.1 iron-sulfur flavoprotein, putative [Entamoeba histolytica HM-1:IMSS]GAT92289.1 nadph-dependent fmn reductase domain containing protein [Entamoeba histolytica]|eukprot:XP_648261.1 iron-sulfur flavoprotein, putative [Entamoeba histolytica HM-1:IMSS]
MVAKVLVLLGTLRANSNSAAYANAFIEGLKSKMEIDVKTINLTKKAVSGCSECFACVPHKELFCTEKDEFIEIANEFLNADIVLFAHPVFWLSIPGEVKNFIDRMICVFDFDNNTCKESFKENFGKKYVVCMPNCRRTTKETAVNAEKPIECFCEMYGIPYSSVYLFANNMDVTQNVQQKETAKKAGIECGEKLMKQNNQF